MAFDQPPEPVSDFLMVVVTVSAPSPPLKVPAVAVSVSPTTAEPVSVGDWPFLWDQLVLVWMKKYLVQERKSFYLYVRHTPALSLSPHSLAQQNRN